MFFQALSNENDGNAVAFNSFFLQQCCVTQHFLTSQSYSCVTIRNANSTVVVIKILNEKVGYCFCQVIRGVVVQK